VLKTAPRKIRESIYSPVADEAYGNFDLASAHELFCEYRKYIEPAFPAADDQGVDDDASVCDCGFRRSRPGIPR
jgi:hypothetical protein